MQYEFNQKKESEIWGIIRKLKEVMLVIFEPDKTLRFLEENHRDTEEFRRFIREMKLIRSEGQEEDGYVGVLRMPGDKKSLHLRPIDGLRSSKKDHYKLHAVRFNNYLLKKLVSVRAGRCSKDGLFV